MPKLKYLSDERKGTKQKIREKKKTNIRMDS